MSILQAYINLNEFVTELNDTVTENRKITQLSPNHLFLGTEQKETHIKMESFTNDFILNQLKNNSSSDSLIFTSLETIPIKDGELTYILYKCYHSLLDQGLVYYQPCNKETIEPIGELQFSNQEENIFFKVPSPDFEESSCNALEAKGSTVENKKIVFLIGNMNEERLLFDIERLILTTLHNSLKHHKLKFEFIISMARYGESFTESYENKLAPIKSACEGILKAYPNIGFGFEFAE